jgi:hypothetical protein
MAFMGQELLNWLFEIRRISCCASCDVKTGVWNVSCSGGTRAVPRGVRPHFLFHAFSCLYFRTFISLKRPSFVPVRLLIKYTFSHPEIRFNIIILSPVICVFSDLFLRDFRIKMYGCLIHACCMFLQSHFHLFVPSSNVS